MLSIPIVGNKAAGVKENTLNGITKLSLLRILANIGAPTNKHIENNNPIIINALLIFSTMFFPYLISFLARKYEYALGKPNVKTNNNVLYKYITCLYVPYSALHKYRLRIAELIRVNPKVAKLPIPTQKACNVFELLTEDDFI